MRVIALQLLIQRLKRLGHVCEHKRPLKGCSALWRAYAAIVADRDAFATALQRNCTDAGRDALPQSEQWSLAGRRPLAWWLPQAVLLKLWEPETTKPVM